MGTHPIFESDFDCLTDMELTWLYTALALLIGALIFLLKSKKEPEQQQNQNQPRPVQAGPGGRRQPRRLRANRDENRVEDLPLGDDSDDNAEPNAGPTVSRFDADGKKIGAKKAKKLEEK